MGAAPTLVTYWQTLHNPVGSAAWAPRIVKAVCLNAPVARGQGDVSMATLPPPGLLSPLRRQQDRRRTTVWSGAWIGGEGRTMQKPAVFSHLLPEHCQRGTDLLR